MVLFGLLRESVSDIVSCMMAFIFTIKIRWMMLMAIGLRFAESLQGSIEQMYESRAPKALPGECIDAGSWWKVLEVLNHGKDWGIEYCYTPEN